MSKPSIEKIEKNAIISSNGIDSLPGTAPIINEKLRFVQHWREIGLKEFTVLLRSFEDVQAFVSIAMVQPFAVVVGSERYSVNGKNFIGMLTLDYNRPVRVRAECSEEAFEQFRQSAQRFLV